MLAGRGAALLSLEDEAALLANLCARARAPGRGERVLQKGAGAVRLSAEIQSCGREGLSQRQAGRASRLLETWRKEQCR
jgi:hypothetical protein